MIQRIQTLLLLGAIGCLTALFFIQIAVFHGDGADVTLDLCFVRSTDPLAVAPTTSFVQYAPYLVVALVFVLIFAVTQYKNRKRQMIVGNFAFLLNLVLLAFLLMAPDQLLELLADGWKQEIKIGYFLPIVSIALIIIANRAIKKDEELVRASDRLR